MTKNSEELDGSDLLPLAGGGLHRAVGGAAVSGEVLRISLNQYKIIFDAAPVSIIVTAEDGAILDINEYHLNHIAKGLRTKDDFLGLIIWSHPSVVRAGMSESFRKVLDGVMLEAKNVHFPETSGGTAAYLNVRGVPVLSEGEVVGGIFIHEDVTELKLAETTLRQALAEVKELRGIIPICSFCKRVRNDQGYWKKIEEYLASNSKADFSHAICPQCFEIHYPEHSQGDG